MAVYMVTYDLKRPGQNYPPLWDELRRLSAHRALESFWLVSVPNTATELHNHLKTLVDQNDSIWVAELTRAHYFSNVRSGTNDWLKRNPPAR